VVKKCSPATVGIVLGNSQGSGVIVSKDGLVLTAGHVAQDPDKDVFLIMNDGKRVKGKTLGMNRGIDSGMIKITENGDWPFVEMAPSADLKPGQWVVALGHPGGFRKDRPPVLRIGRVLTATSSLIDTDCTLVGGDSGGPLFNLDGKVIGIHSRIGGSTLSNIHVPLDTFTETWDRLAKGEAWGNDRFAASKGPVLGITGEASPKGCRIAEMTKDGPAAKAGLKIGDIIWSMDEKDVTSLDSLSAMIAKKKAGDEVTLQVLRGEEKLEIKAKLGKRPGA
jgi:serine protease Do